MALLSFLDPAMNAAFGWLLNLPPFWGIAILCFILSLLIVVIYKFTTNQSVMKALKEELKVLQKEMRELRSDPSKMMEVNKKAMEANMKYMSHSFRPMIFTFIPVILIFGWLNGHLAFEPIMPGQEFSMTVQFASGANGVITANTPDGMDIISDANRTVTDGSAIFTFKAPQEGTYDVTFDFNNQTYIKEVDVTQARKYAAPILSVNDGAIKTITTNHQKTQVIHIGSWGMTWFWSYLVLSLIFSFGLRKLFKVY